MCRSQESLQNGILGQLQATAVQDWIWRGMQDDLPTGAFPFMSDIRSDHRKPLEQGVRDCELRNVISFTQSKSFKPFRNSQSRTPSTLAFLWSNIFDMIGKAPVGRSSCIPLHIQSGTALACSWPSIPFCKLSWGQHPVTNCEEKNLLSIKRIFSFPIYFLHFGLEYPPGDGKDLDRWRMNTSWNWTRKKSLVARFTTMYILWGHGICLYYSPKFTIMSLIE